METARWLMLAGPLLYALAAGLALGYLLARRAPSQGVLFGIVSCGFVLHSAGLQMRGMAVGGCPIGNPYEVFQFISWSITLVYVFTGPVFRMTILGTFSAALAAILGLLPAAVPAWDETRRSGFIGGNPWIETHAALALLSYGVFGLLATTAVMYLFQQRGLRRKQWGDILRFLPSIVQLETMNMRLLAVACGIFTTSQAIGMVYWFSDPGSISFGKLGITLGVWLAYLLIFLLRLSQRLHGTRFAWSCVVLFLFALLALWAVEMDRTAAPPPVDAVHAPFFGIPHGS
ncbi:MAG: cytochrome c biogenesis protein CcsA [Opitutales bacterium]|nr:cytochrome c biogenesis protein CcsA [Opitutales bacterium]